VQGSLLTWVTFDATGRYAYVADSGSLGISEYLIDANSGGLTRLGSIVPTHLPTTIAVDPSGRHLYSVGGGTVQQFDIASENGTLTPSNQASAPAGPASQAITIDGSGKFVYVGDALAGIGGYARDAASGALTPLAGSPFSSGVSQTSLAISSRFE